MKNFKDIRIEIIQCLSKSILNKLNDSTGKHCFLIIDTDSITFFEINNDIESVMGIIYNKECDCGKDICEFGDVSKYLDIKDIIRLFYIFNKEEF